MLQLERQQFTSGVLNYLDEDPDRRRPHASIYIPVNITLPDGKPFSVLAFVDTGSPYVMVGRDIIQALGLTPAAAVANLTVETATGRMRGFLDRIDLVIPATVAGDSLSLEVQVFACEDWERGVFLGYSGCMSHMNFAVQPTENRFFFGPPQ